MQININSLFYWLEVILCFIFLFLFRFYLKYIVSLQVKHTVVKQPDKDGSITHAHIVEIAGPILPHHTQSLITLYHKTQQENFGIVFNNHDITAPFNFLGRLNRENEDTEVKNENDIAQNYSDSDKTKHDVAKKHFIHKPVSDRICAIKEIVCTPEGFTWNT